MDTNFNKFMDNLNYEYNVCIESDSLNKNNQKNVKDRIIFNYEKKLDEFEINLFTYKAKYPLPMNELINSNGIMKEDCFKVTFDTLVILSYIDKDIKKYITIDNLFYTCSETLEDAEKEYNKLYNIINRVTDSEELFYEFLKLMGVK